MKNLNKISKDVPKRHERYVHSLYSLLHNGIITVSCFMSITQNEMKLFSHCEFVVR